MDDEDEVMSYNDVIYDGNDSDLIPGTEEELIETPSTAPPSKSDFSQLQTSASDVSCSIPFFLSNERQDSKGTERTRNGESIFKQSHQAADYLGRRFRSTQCERARVDSKVSLNLFSIL